MYSGCIDMDKNFIPIFCSLWVLGFSSKLLFHSFNSNNNLKSATNRPYDDDDDGGI